MEVKTITIINIILKSCLLKIYLKHPCCKNKYSTPLKKHFNHFKNQSEKKERLKKKCIDSYECFTFISKIYQLKQFGTYVQIICNMYLSYLHKYKTEDLQTLE